VENLHSQLADKFTLQCVALCCSVSQRVAVCCRVLQCAAVCNGVEEFVGASAGTRDH